jgi:autotransporter-associated beta strand protein
MLEGPGTWILAATGMTYTNKLIVTNGTLQLNGSFPDLINILVDQDGVLEAVPAQFPSASVVTQNGGIWNVPTSATWTGLGDGSNWTDTANWAPNIIPTDQADLTATLASDRYINVDSDATVDTIVIVDGGNQYARHHLVLSADLTVETIDGGHDKYKSHIHVNDANTLTVGETIGTGAYMPNLDGSGTVIKHTTGTVTLQGAPDSFTGSFIVTNGTLRFRASTYANTLLLTVLDGTTANLLSVGADFPTNIVINGTGFGGAGALSWSTTDSHTSDITVNTDSTIVRGSGTTTLSGEISGPGDLTLDAGTGVFDLDGTYNFAISGAAANNMIADDGTLNIGDATLDVGNETGASELEYVIIDYSGSGTVSGQFTATNDLDAGWTVEYAGTATYTDSVVLVKTASPPETVIKFQ